MAILLHDTGESKIHGGIGKSQVNLKKGSLWPNICLFRAVILVRHFHNGSDFNGQRWDVMMYTGLTPGYPCNDKNKTKWKGSCND